MTGDGTIVGSNYRLRIFSFTPSGNNFTIQLNTDSNFFIKNKKSTSFLSVNGQQVRMLLVILIMHNLGLPSRTTTLTISVRIYLFIGVNTSMYGGPIDGKRCIIGYHIINVFFDSSTVEVLMNMNGTDIMGIT